MIENTKTTKIKKIICALYVVIYVVSIFFLFAPLAHATEREIDSYTVLHELNSAFGENQFNEEDYVANDEDYSIRVIQIGIGGNGELYLYCVQPCDGKIELVAEKVQIHEGFSSSGAGLSPKIYDLELISTNGIFDKYRVLNDDGSAFVPAMNADGQIWLNITGIHRPYDELVGDDIAAGVISGFTPCGPAFDYEGNIIGQQHCATYVNGTYEYQMNTFDVLEIEVTFSGFLRMYNGFDWTDWFDESGCDAWFIAFSFGENEIPAKDIMEAELKYSYNTHKDTNKISCATFGGSDGIICRDKEPYFMEEITESGVNIPLILSAENNDTSFTPSGWWANDFSWKRIMKASDFVKNFENQGMDFTSQVNQLTVGDDGNVLESIDVTANAKNVIAAQSEWVFAFKETGFYEEDSHYHDFMPMAHSDIYTLLEDVAILRIKYRSEVGVFDLGVVGDIVTPDSVADGISGKFATLQSSIDEILQIITMIIGIVILATLLNFITPVMAIIKFVVQLVFNVVGGIISIPIKVINLIFKER